MRSWQALVTRDLARDMRSGSWWLPVAFFLLVAMLYPFAVGPDMPLLRATGGGILWVAALLASILPIERLFSDDAQSGVLDQLALRGIADEAVAAAKLIAHIIGFGIPILIVTIPASALLNLTGETLRSLIIGLAIGLPGLSGLTVMVAAIMLGGQGRGALGGLMMLPLAVPILIFGAGSIQHGNDGALLYLAASSLLLTGIAPFAAGAALRAARER